MHTRIIIGLLCVSFAFTAGCKKAGIPAVANNPNSAETLGIDNDPLELNEAEQIHVEFTKRHDSFYERYDTLSDEEKIKQINEAPDVCELFDQWKRIAKENPGTPTAASSYAWLCIYGRGADDEVMEKMFGEYINSPKLRDVCMTLPSSTPSKKIEERLERAIKHSPHSEVQWAAKLALAEYLVYVVEGRKVAEKYPDRVDDVYGPEQGARIRDYLKNFDSDGVQQRAIQLLESVVADHPDHEIEKDKIESFGEIANRALFELKQLSPGQVAPEIVGSDLEGVEFKLSDYRGKVVLLSFWADW